MLPGNFPNLVSSRLPTPGPNSLLKQCTVEDVFKFIVSGRPVHVSSKNFRSKPGTLITMYVPDLDVYFRCRTPFSRFLELKRLSSRFRRAKIEFH